MKNFCEHGCMVVFIPGEAVNGDPQIIADISLSNGMRAGETVVSIAFWGNADPFFIRDCCQAVALRIDNCMG
jgi:hypothetical protein